MSIIPIWYIDELGFLSSKELNLKLKFEKGPQEHQNNNRKCPFHL